jgi:CBS-domain-containing membrane protein
MTSIATIERLMRKAPGITDADSREKAAGVLREYGIAVLIDQHQQPRSVTSVLHGCRPQDRLPKRSDAAALFPAMNLTDIATVKPDEPVLVAVKKLARNQDVGIVVVDIEGRYQGVALIQDIAKALEKLAKDFAEVAERAERQRQEFNG